MICSRLWDYCPIIDFMLDHNTKCRYFIQFLMLFLCDKCGDLYYLYIRGQGEKFSVQSTTDVTLGTSGHRVILSCGDIIEQVFGGGCFCCLVWAVDLGVQITDEQRSLYIGSFCPAMTSLSRYSSQDKMAQCTNFFPHQ